MPSASPSTAPGTRPDPAPGGPVAPAPDRPAPPKRGRRRARRWTIALGSILLALAAVFYLGGGWYFSGVLNHDALDASVKRAATPTYDARVVSVSGVEGIGDAAQITLRVPQDPDQFLTPGTWGLESETGGYGQVTTITGTGSGRVTRTFHQIAGPPITAGQAVRLDNAAYPVNPQVGLGLDYQDVTYDGPLGSYPAWYIPGASDTWAILLHGNSLDRLDTIKVVPVIHRAGLPTLVISYRNDEGAPADPSGKLRYGLTEWKDLEAAVRYATDHGASRVVLVGFSMGGGIATSFLERSPLASDVSGVILDSPMLDFGKAVDLGASQKSLPVVGLPVPQSLTDVAKWIAGWRYDVDWKALNYLPGASTIRAPILLFQGTSDTTVPSSTSDALAAELPDTVTYLRVTGAEHIDSWNVDPARYEAAVQEFLARIGATSAGASGAAA
jgi:pimeloyl-ACP methyl ester carboxylesterase